MKGNVCWTEQDAVPIIHRVDLCGRAPGSYQPTAAVLYKEHGTVRQITLAAAAGAAASDAAAAATRHACAALQPPITAAPRSHR